MKKSISKLIIGILIILMLSTVSIGHTPEVADCSIDRACGPILAAVVWSDNFDDEDVSDWQLFTVNHSASPDTLLPGNSTAVGGVLRLIGEEWNYAGHNSSVAFGSWNFSVDIQDPEDEYHFSIAFISEQFDDDWLILETVGEAYGVAFYINDVGDHEIRLTKGSHDLGHSFLDYYYNENILGWKNIIVTRELSGQFYVYLDGDLILRGKDLYHTTSERFYILSHAGPAIDNVSVHDDIIYDAAPPEFDSPIPNQEITAGESFYYDVNATDHSGIDKWWIDDTENFTIDENGVITSNHDLAVGQYIPTVRVNDTLGYTRGDAFSLIVNPATTTTTTPTTTSPPTDTTPTTTDGPPPPIPMELILVAGGGIVVILVLVIWKTRK